jgi:DNA-binding transcriptional LysR family regulator
VAALAGRLADEHGAYQGQWHLGIRMDRLRGAVPLDLLPDHPFDPLGNPYSRDDYERVTSASTEELVNSPHAVAERLVAPLPQGLSKGMAYHLVYLPENMAQPAVRAFRAWLLEAVAEGAPASRRTP